MASSNSQDVKRRIKTITSMEHITNAMKLVSSAKLRRARTTFEKTNQNFHFINQTINEIFENASHDVESIYMEGSREIKKTCYVVITSNKGLCGSFNSNVIKETERLMALDDSEAVMIAIGSKGRDYFQKKGIKIIQEYLAPPENITFLETRDASGSIINMYDAGEIDRVVMVYTAYINSMEVAVKESTLLPFSTDSGLEAIKHDKEVEYSPSLEEVFNYLVPKQIELALYGAIIESATCEHTARRMAMENATDSARDMLGELSLSYNRARQAAITNEIIEVVSGSEAQN